VSDQAVNIDEFRHRPVHEVAALLPGREPVELALDDLRSADVDTREVRILYGEEGAHILDRTGAEHGILTQLVRTLQNLGYDENILAVYDEGLRSQEALMTVPCAPERRYEVGNLLRARGAHGIIYFGRGRAETLSGP
jgi:hypothetical protein